MTTILKRRCQQVAGTLALAGAVMAAGLSPALAQNVKIVGLMELTGTGATSGTNFDNGIKLAVKEINAAGGILGKKIDYVSMDTQSNPGVAKGLGAKGGGPGGVCGDGPGVLRLYLGQHGRNPPRRIAQFHGR